MTKIPVICPFCKAVGGVDVPRKDVRKNEGGLLRVLLAPEIICEHCFLIYVDNNLKIRSYLPIDNQLGISRLSPVKIFPM